ncbi:MAG: prepilin-type N-terminal cleavage/methylation domain-containing protein [Candidatus Levybacteria bacterium]|nr:prepilin-type N-terminal cleavage/methylation domain-containing protein [Candidatus Levybacteria bacterium]
MKNYGFTLIELIVAFSVIALLSTVGIASFVSYSRNQALVVSAKDLVNTLNLAKSRSLSQVLEPSQCSGQSLIGYEVRLCGLLTSSCPPLADYSYELNVVCSGIIVPPIETKKLPPGVSFDNATQTTSFLFPILTGGVKGSGAIVLSGYGQTKTVTVSNSGVIQ